MIFPLGYIYIDVLAGTLPLGVRPYSAPAWEKSTPGFTDPNLAAPLGLLEWL